MITGIGIDIIEINRIKKAIESSGNAFLNKVFSDKEKKYCYSQKNPYQHFAARFAAKEAVLKSAGLGLYDVINLNTIEITNTDTGKPKVILNHKIKNLKTLKKFKKITISLSHSKNYAVAVAVLEI